MKSFVAAIVLAASTVASAASLIENKAYTELYLNFENDQQVVLEVEGERYRADRPRTLVTINEVTDGLIVVDQENLYYTMDAVYPPLPIKTQRDSASLVIAKDGRWSVRVLVPANLKVSVSRLQSPHAPICMAYFMGFVYDMESDSCKQIGASGCSSPFEFHTLDACESGNLLK